MYVAVKGGERAIENAHRLLAHERRGDPRVPDLSLPQISEQLSLAVDRVMTEGSLYDRELAALAIKQARGDMIEAIFLLRAYRATLPRFGATEPLDTSKMRARRRVSSTFKDIPGGQILGPTFDYTHRLLDPALIEDAPVPAPAEGEVHDVSMPRVTDILGADGLIESSPPDDPGVEVGDLTREPLSSATAPRLQILPGRRGISSRRILTSADLVEPIRSPVKSASAKSSGFFAEDAGSVPLGELTLTECQMVNRSKGLRQRPVLPRGYGLASGERKTMSWHWSIAASRANL